MNCMKTSLFGFSTSLHLRDRQEGFLPNIGNWEQKFLACFLEASILSNPCINFVLLLFLFSYFVVFFPTSFNHCLILLLSKIHMIRNLSKEKPTFVKVESHLSLNRFFCTTLNELCWYFTHHFWCIEEAKYAIILYYLPTKMISASHPSSGLFYFSEYQLYQHSGSKKKHKNRDDTFLFTTKFFIY
jgi:hypothetical protein